MHDFLEDELAAASPDPYRGSEEIVGKGGFIRIGEVLGPIMETAANFRKIGKSCDSPIEEELGACVLTYFASKGHPLKLNLEVDLRCGELILVPQFKWSFYRSDWAILRARPQAQALLIECDGKDFHSSPEQRIHDARKDAAATAHGHLTIRFTGSEIFRRPKACAAKIFEATGL